MQDNIYERIQKTLSWKKIIGFNVVLFLVLIVPLTVSLSQQDTENRSNAAFEEPIEVPPPNYPAGSPRIDRVSTFFGKTGDTVVLLGSNFGDYQWGSHVFIGNTEASNESVVRWSNTVLEVKIPEGARTGAVWVNVNAREARWEGSLLLVDVARAAQVGLQKVTSTEGKIFATNASGAVQGMVELSYVSEPLIVTPAGGVTMAGQVPSSDSLGKKMRINLEFPTPLISSRTELANFTYPGLGTVEIIRAELYDANGRILSIFSDPLSIKITP